MQSVVRFVYVEVNQEIIVLAITDGDQHVNLTLLIILSREYQFSSMKRPNL